MKILFTFFASLLMVGFSYGGVLTGVAKIVTKAAEHGADNAVEHAVIHYSDDAARAAAKGGGKAAVQAASAVAPAADGPLPVGDIIAVAGFAWTAYDVNNLINAIPKEIAKSLNETVDTLQAQTIDEVSKAIRQTRNAHVQAARALATSAWAAQDDLPSPTQ